VSSRERERENKKDRVGKGTADMQGKEKRGVRTTEVIT
jgi:hypothetical protein